MTNNSLLETLEFHKVKDQLEKLAPSTLSKQLAQALKPMHDKELIEEALSETEEALRLLENEISTPLGETHNIYPILQNANKDVLLLPQDFLDLLATLETYKKMHHYFEGEKHLKYPLLEELAGLIVPSIDLIRAISLVFDEKGEIKSSASPKLARIYTAKEIIKNKIRKTFQSLLADKNMSSYFQDALVTQRNGRYVVPIKEEYRNKFEGIVHDRSSSGQTIFMEPLMSVHLNNDLTELLVEEKQVIHEILTNLTKKVKENGKVLRQNIELASKIEFIFAKARLAQSMSAVRAHYSSSHVMSLKKARHPLIPKEQMVPIGIFLGENYKILIITGANAGGKTIALKTAGLLALMNQSGLFIPAEEGSTLPIYKNIYAIIGDEQSIQYNLSTFSSYITQLVNFLAYTGKNDLILLDELGSGTDPLEGAALAQAVTEYLQMKNVSAIITSHFTEMKKLAYESKGIENAFVEFDEKTLTPKYNLVIGAAGSSNAFSICKRLDMPELILSRAKSLKETSALFNMEEVMNRLNEERVELEHKKTELEHTLNKASQLKHELEVESEKFYDRRDSILSKARMEAEDIKRNTRVQSEQIIKDLKKKAATIRSGDVSEYVKGIRNSVDKLHIPKATEYREKLSEKDLVVGQTVYIDTIKSDGVITHINRGKITVQCGSLTVTVDPTHCFKSNNRLKPKKSQPPMPTRKPAMEIQSITTSLNVIGKTVDEAIPLVDKFLNDSFMAGISPVEIIHGKGTGKLRQGIHEHLRRLNFITNFREADVHHGGAGVTEVYF